MASITIRNIDEELKNLLRMEAASKRISMEEEVRQILRRFVLQKKCTEGLGDRLASRFAKIGGVELPPVTRSVPRSEKIIYEE